MLPGKGRRLPIRSELSVILKHNRKTIAPRRSWWFAQPSFSRTALAARSLPSVQSLAAEHVCFDPCSLHQVRRCGWTIAFEVPVPQDGKRDICGTQLSLRGQAVGTSSSFIQTHVILVRFDASGGYSRQGLAAILSRQDLVNE